MVVRTYESFTGSK